MTNRSLKKLCELFYAAHYYPLACFKKDGTLDEAFCAFAPFADVFRYHFGRIEEDRNPAILSGSVGIYGVIRLRAGGQTVLLGPFLYGSPSETSCDKLIHEANLPWDRKEELQQFLTQIPPYSYNQFLNLIAFLHYILNGEEISVTEHFRLADNSYSRSIGTRQSAEHWSEELRYHGTYAFEQQLLSFIRAGGRAGAAVVF